MKRKRASEKEPEQLFSLKLFLLILGIIIIVIILTYFYFTSKNCEFPADRIVSEHGLEKSDWLAFWGCVLGVSSTIVFSTLTWRQNKIFKDINDKNREEEFKLSTMRYKSECYSMTSLKHVCFFERGDGEKAISLQFNDRGKIIPRKMFDANLEISFLDRAIHPNPIIYLSGQEASFTNIPSGTGEGFSYHVDFVLGLEVYNQLISMFREDISEKHSKFVINLDCKIDNVMDVITHMQCNASLKLVENSTLDDKKDVKQQKVLFYIPSPFETIESIYIVQKAIH